MAIDKSKLLGIRFIDHSADYENPLISAKIGIAATPPPPVVEDEVIVSSPVSSLSSPVGQIDNIQGFLSGGGQMGNIAFVPLDDVTGVAAGDVAPLSDKSVWVNASYTSGDVDNTDKAGLEYNGHAITLGLHTNVMNNVVDNYGLLFSYAKSDSDNNVALGNLGGGSDTYSYSVGGYLRKTFSPKVVVDVAATAGTLDIDNTRNTAGGTAYGSTDGHVFTAYSKLSYKNELENNTFFNPFVKVSASSARINGYEETGIVNVYKYEDQQTDQLTSVIGADVEKSFTVNDVYDAQVTATLGWAKQHSSEDSVTVSSYGGSGPLLGYSAPTAVSAATISDDALNYGLSGSVQRNDYSNIEAYAGIYGNHGSDSKNYTVSAGFKYKW